MTSPTCQINMYTLTIMFITVLLIYNIYYNDVNTIYVFIVTQYDNSNFTIM